MSATPDAILNTVPRMRESVFFEGDDKRHKLSRFWMLLILAAVIASAGVVSNSDATVIGAMIVAPMMIPIQGAMLSTVIGDRANLVRSVLLILAGAAAAIAIGYLVGLLDPLPITAATNAEVASRVSPGLIAMLAALGTGVVGSIALARSDISDTLPGVAIAISLVPPLTVVGLTAESGAWGESLGALLLFVTNVAAILATGVAVMTFYRVRVRVLSAAEGAPARRGGPIAIAVIIVGLVIVLIPLTTTTVGYVTTAQTSTTLQSVGDKWAQEHGLTLDGVTVGATGSTMSFSGELPFPSTSDLESALRSAGVTTEIHVEFSPQYTKDLPATK